MANKYTELRKMWSRRKQKNKEIRESGLCLVIQVRVGTTVRINVISPYSEDFVVGARELLGVWRPKTGMWSFALAQREAVIRLCRKCYGSYVKVEA